MSYCGFLLNHKAFQKRQLRHQQQLQREASKKSEGKEEEEEEEGKKEVAAVAELKEKRCRMQKKKGRQFCPQHEIAAAAEAQAHNHGKGGDTTGTLITASTTDRVPCPYGGPQQ